MFELVDYLADLTACRDRDVLDTTLVCAIKTLLGPESVAIYRCVGDSGQECWLNRARLSGQDVVATSDPAWIDLESLPPLLEHPHRVTAMKSCEITQVPGATSHLSVFPVITDRENGCVLEIDSSAPLSVDSQRLICGMLNVYRNLQGLLDYSERDTLTGLLNRKTFDESFLKATAEPQILNLDGTERRTDQSGGTFLGVLDIDHFKRVNDTYGHLIGDEVLLLLSRLLRTTFRIHDQLYRFGGEEFVVLMRCANQDGAARAFERLRANTEAYAFPMVGHITVSIGFTRVKSGDTPNGAFERADKAVYFAKGHGRNCVHNHADLVAKGELEDDSKTGDVELF
jgi:diguanylate cyclase (GGDEF)-like protein